MICKMDGRALGSRQFGLLAQVLFEGDGAGAFCEIGAFWGADAGAQD